MVRRAVGLLYLLELAGMAVGLALSLPGIQFSNVCVVINVPRTLIINA